MYQDLIRKHKIDRKKDIIYIYIYIYKDIYYIHIDIYIYKDIYYIHININDEK